MRLPNRDGPGYATLHHDHENSRLEGSGGTPDSEKNRGKEPLKPRPNSKPK